MHDVTITSTLASETPETLTAAAARAGDWFGEPFLHEDEDPLAALAPGTARRAALDDALAEIEAGLRLRQLTRPTGTNATSDAGIARTRRVQRPASTGAASR